MNAVEVKNLSFRYGKKVVFKNVSFDVEKGSFLTVLGKGGSGKSTLFKILSGQYDNGGGVCYFGKSVKYSLEKGYVGFISPFLNNFEKSTVADEFIDVLKSKGKSLDNIKIEIGRVVKKIGIEDLLYSNFNDLSFKEKILVMIAYQILFRPKILILDNIFVYLDAEFKVAMREIKRLNKRMTIINLTNNTSECIYGDKTYVIGDDDICDVIKLKSNYFIDKGLRVPFMIMLSSRLKSYDLINDNYLDMEMLVDKLWK